MVRRLLCLSLAWIASTAVARALDSAEPILTRRRQLEETRRWTERYRRFVIHEDGGLSREVEICEERSPDRRSATLAFILSPTERRGEGFLIQRFPDGAAQRHLYVPWQRHPRQVSSGSDVPSFVGPDLDAHDLELLQDVETWAADDVVGRLRGEEVVDGVPAYVLELTPRRPDPVYRMIVIWLGKDDLIARRVELYADGPGPRRRLTQSAVRMIGAVPVPYRIDAESPDVGTHTAIDVSEVEFDAKRAAVRFEPTALDRGTCR
jgi:hypothetical protein